MAITKDPSGSVSVRKAGGSNISSLSQSYTVNSGSNFLLVRLMHWRNPGTTVSGITWGAQNFTLIGRQPHNNTQDIVEMWRLVNPNPGTANVVISYTDALNESSAWIDAWTGVDTANPTGTLAGANVSSSTDTPTVNATSIAGDMVVDAMIAYIFGTITADASQTVDGILDEDQAINSLGASHETAVGTSTTMSWSLTSDIIWAIAAVALKPAAASNTIAAPWITA
ncbi:hypothetical protein EYC59_03015 [Candidatus Saccharibacteria bacterium]|nr:MAG: hypothetical protein EYC59_03015 [Candidatus Saccharibacteria bacterium]